MQRTIKEAFRALAKRREEAEKLQEKSLSTNNAVFAYPLGGGAHHTPPRYEALAAEGYQRNALVFRCVRLIADAASRVPWHVYCDGQSDPHHPFAVLLNQPNNAEGRVTFLKTVFSHLLLSGNAFIEAVIDPETHTPAALYALRPNRIRVEAKAGQLTHYMDAVNGRERRIGPDPRTGTFRLLHLKMFHPLNDWYGMSPLEALALAIDQHNTVSSHNLSLLQNGGRPSGALFLRSGARNLTPEQRASLKEDLTRAYQGGPNAGRIMVLEGDFEWREMGLSPKDLDFLSGKLTAAREIAQAYGVPPVLLGLGSESSIQSQHYAEARLYLWEDTILPLLDQVMENVTAWMRPFYGDGASVVYHPDEIEALAPRRESIWKRVQEADFLSAQEKRTMLGLSI